MSEDFKNMDDAFKNLEEGMNFSYSKNLWEQMESQLENDAMDAAFQNAANNFESSAGLDFNAIDDAFLDDAFAEAAKKVEYGYHSDFWNEFEKNKSDLELDNSFNEASQAAKAVYHPHYWVPANEALTEEGLHFEYQQEYWDEARAMLEKSERGKFFFRWSLVATVLLLLSFGATLNFSEEAYFENVSNLSILANPHGSVAKKNFTEVTLKNFVSLYDDREFMIENQNPEEFIGGSNENLTAYQELNQLERVETNNPNGTAFNPTNQSGDASRPSNGGTESAQEGQLVMDGSEGQTTINLPINTQENNSELIQNEHFQSNNTLLESLGLNKEVNKIQPIKIVNPIYNFSAPEMPQVEILKPQLSSNEFIQIYAGYGQGGLYGSPNDVNLNQSNPYSQRVELGVNFNKSIGRLKRAEFGLNVNIQQNKQNNIGWYGESKKYRMDGLTGAEYYFVDYDIKDVYYGGVGFNLNYRIGPKHILMSTINVARVLNVRSDLRYKVDDNDPVEIINNWGILSGMELNDLTFGIGYKYQLNQKIGVFAMGTFGVMDRTDNLFLGDFKSDKEQRVVVGLSYNIFTKF